MSEATEIAKQPFKQPLPENFHKIEVAGEPKRTFSSFVKGYLELPVIVHRK